MLWHLPLLTFLSVINISSVVLGEEIEQEVLGVLRSGMIAQGPKVAEFEKLFADIVEVPHAVAVNNGTTSLIAALKMSGMPEGSEVVMPPFTFVATLNAALEAGYKVRFADINPHTFNATAETLAAAATHNTAGVMPVHLYGQCADIAAIDELAKKNNWFLLEDAAQAHGATHNGRQAGSFGAGSFSFYATKNVTTGEGGIITTSDDAFADRLRVFRNQGMRVRYQYDMQGNNFRMTDLQAAVGIPQLRHFNDIITARQRNAEHLIALMSDIEEIQLPVVAEGNNHVWHQFTIRITSASKRRRDEVIDRLAELGVGSGIYYPRLTHDYECFKGDPNVIVTDTPIAAQTVKEVVSIPVHMHLTPQEIEIVAAAVRSAVQGV